MLTEHIRLAIGHNYLSQLPQQIGLCNNLLYLNLRHNKFTAIPDSVSERKGVYCCGKCAYSG